MGFVVKAPNLIVHDMMNNTGYGAHLELSHNSNWSRFPFLPPEVQHGNEAGREYST